MAGFTLDDIIARLNELDGCALEAIRTQCTIRLRDMGWFVAPDEFDTGGSFMTEEDDEDNEAQLELIEYFDNHSFEEFDDGEEPGEGDL